MDRKFSWTFRGWSLVVALLSLAASLFIVSINPLSIGLALMLLFLVVLAVGLLTNPWGGLAASAISVLAMGALNQFIGVYTTQNPVISIAGEFAIFLAVGPLGGLIALTIEKENALVRDWVTRAESLDSRDRTFNTMKPDWSLVRLEEEVARAERGRRPLAVAMLHISGIGDRPLQERVASIKALLRICQSSTSTPSVVAYHGENRVLLILPEFSEMGTQELLAEIRERAGSELPVQGAMSALERPALKQADITVSQASFKVGREDSASFLQRVIDGLPTG